MVILNPNQRFPQDLNPDRKGWHSYEARSDGFSAGFGDFIFICSEARELDGKWWTHLSMSKKGNNKLTYSEMKYIKNKVLGKGRTAIQVFPSEEKHVDYTGQFGVHVLHLWSCEDMSFLPDFTRGTGMI